MEGLKCLDKLNGLMETAAIARGLVFGGVTGMDEVYV